MVPNAMPIFTDICQVKAKLMIGERAENVMVVAEIMVIEDKGLQGWKRKSLSRVRLCNPMDYTVHGILQARIPEWVAFPFSRVSSQPRDQTQVSLIAGGFFTSGATREAQEHWRE